MGVTAVTKHRFYPDPTSSLSPKNGHFRRLLTAYTTGTCGRATYKLTWKEIVALYRLTERQPAANSHQIAMRRNRANQKSPGLAGRGRSMPLNSSCKPTRDEKRRKARGAFQVPP